MALRAGFRVAGYRLAAIVVAGAMLFGEAQALAADPITLRAGLHEDFGRLVFDFNSKVPYKVETIGNRLRVTFDKAAAFKPIRVASTLKGYVGAPRVGEGGRVVEFPLKGAFELRHFTLGSKVVVDLLQPAGREAVDRRVRVRVGEHPGFSRLVFDWRRVVGSRLRQKPGEAVVTFDRAAEFDLSRYTADPPPGVDGVSVKPQGKGVAVTLSVQPGARVRLSQSGSKQVIDVFTVADPKTAKAPAVKPKAAAPALANTSQDKQAPPEKKTDPAKTGASTPDKPPQGGRKAAQPPLERPVQSAKAGEAGKPEQTAKTPEAPEKAPAKEPMPLLPKALEPARGKSPASANQIVPPRSTDAAKHAAGKSQTQEEPQAKGRLRAKAEIRDPDAETPRLGRSAVADIPVVLTFEWDEPAAAAAFRRGPHIWLVFDQPAPEGIGAQISAANPNLGPVVQVAMEGATILRLTASSLLAPRLSRKDNVWTVDIRARSLLPETTIRARLAKAGVGTNAIGDHVRLPVSGAGRMQWFRDPDQGDQLVAIPVRRAGAGIPESVDYPQFQILASQQGVILRPLSDGVEVATTKRAILVRERGGLLVSSKESREKGSLDRGNKEPPRRLFDLAKWRQGPAEDFIELKQEMQNGLVTAEGRALAIARLNLARFYFAHGRGSETLGILRVIAEETPHLAKDPEVLLMKAASEILIEDFDAAGQSLAHPALLDEWDALIWRAALAAAAQDWQTATLGFDEAGSVIAEYPHSVRNRLHLWAAEARLGIGDSGGASQYLAAVRKDDPTEAQAQQMLFLTGGSQKLDGDTALAKELWQRVAAGNHAPSRARARLALIELGLEQGTTSSEDAIADLERLRFAWRGDAFEFALLRRLADLYLETGRYRSGLHALRQAATHFPQTQRSQEVVQKMRRTFADLYLNDDGVVLSPIKALALYDEFKELTPVGAEGDKLITHLADRLVEVDLLTRAGDLLEGQVRYRLKGEEKARVGARLALIRLLDRDPEETLEVLKSSAVEGLPESLQLQRRHLQVRALAELERSEDALALLSGDNTADGIRLRADILWTRRDWAGASRALGRLVPPSPPDRPLTETESRTITNLAIALTLAGGRGRLISLNKRYKTAMEETPHRETFKLLAGDIDPTGTRTIADELKSIAPAQAFMTSYRERLENGPLSAIN